MMKLVMKLSFVVALAAASGCAEHTQPSTEFASEGAAHPHQRMGEIQRANGARADGNLYAAHFTDHAVNSLGRAKLDAMMSDDETVRPLTVHMAAAPDRHTLMRRIESVTAYLKDHGLTDEQIRFVSGLNDASYHPAAPGLAHLRKLERDEPAAAADRGPESPGAGFGDGDGDGMSIK
jgi:hypothetical protein